MDFVPRLMFIPLQLLFFVLVAKGQSSIISSIVCLNATTNTPCRDHTLTCPANTSIFILEAENGFVFSPSPQSSCAGGVCDQQCCSRDNFQCSEPMSNLNFGIYFSSCWGKTSCTTPALFDARSFTDGNTNCSGKSSLAFVSHQCIANSSVLRFDDGGSVAGTAVVVRYRKTESTASTCLEPNNTLECDVTVDGSSASTDVRVMLAVWHFRGASPCSTLSITDSNVSTGMQSCSENVYSYNSNKVTGVGVSLALTLQKDNLPVEAWAVVSSNTTTLRMTCGKGTCKPSREFSQTTQIQSTSASTSHVASTSAFPPTTAVEPSTTAVQLSSTSASKPTSLPTTASDVLYHMTPPTPFP